MEKTIADIAQEQAEREAIERDANRLATTPMPPGRYRIVNDRDLEHATHHGSRIVRVLERHTMHKAEAYENVTRNGYTSHERVEKSEWGPGQAFLIFTPVSAEEREKEFQRAYDQAREASSRACAAETELKRVQDSRAEDAKALTERIASWMRERDTYQKQASDAVERARKMELDLGKVRKEIGEAAWKKILAEGT
jgi:hypothetical protein